MRFEDQLFLIQTHGLPADAIHYLASEEAAWERGTPGVLETAAGRRSLEQRLLETGRWRGGAIAWPSLPQTRRLAAALERAGVRLAWRGGADYPEKLTRRLGGEAPHWVWLAGAAGRLAAPACAMIGSRQSAPPFLAAARRLGRALADAEVVVASGMAAGADTAAHEGARAGRAGTLAIPAQGLLTAGLPLDNPGARASSPAPPSTPPQPAAPSTNTPQSPTPHSALRIPHSSNPQSAIPNPQFPPPAQAAGGFHNQTWLALDRPEAPFSAGLAIRRNDVIAAMGDAMVLVASGLKGGSSYAVRWALRHGAPLFCFEAGAATPAANRALIRAGQAQALALAEAPEAWVARILPAIARRRAAPPENAAPAPLQLDWLAP